MENTKVNSNKFIALKNELKDMSIMGYICMSILFLLIIGFILVLQFLIRDAFFTDSLICSQTNLLGEYQTEIEKHNLDSFYNSVSTLNTNSEVVENLHIYQMSDTHNVEKFPISSIPISLKILNTHKNKGMNNTDYLVDLTYISNNNNHYQIKHQTVIMKTDDLYYLESAYSNYLQILYKAIHEQFLLDTRIKTEPSQEIKDSISKDFKLLTPDTTKIKR